MKQPMCTSAGGGKGWYPRSSKKTSAKLGTLSSCGKREEIHKAKRQANKEKKMLAGLQPPPPPPFIPLSSSISSSSSLGSIFWAIYTFLSSSLIYLLRLKIRDWFQAGFMHQPTSTCRFLLYVALATFTNLNLCILNDMWQRHCHKAQLLEESVGLRLSLHLFSPWSLVFFLLVLVKTQAVDPVSV